MSSTSSAPPPWAVALEHYLTPQRLTSYMVASRGDRGKALALYHWNNAMSAALWELLSYVEVIVRNALDESATTWHTSHGQPGGPDWWDHPGLLDQRGLDDVATAQSRCRQDVSHGRVVAELGFGFWRFLLASAHEATLWTPALRHAFPNLVPQSRRGVYDPLQRLNTMRNRIAHHEPIHRAGRLEGWHQDMLDVTGFVSADLATWLQSKSRFNGLKSARPI